MAALPENCPMCRRAPDVGSPLTPARPTTRPATASTARPRTSPALMVAVDGSSGAATPAAAVRAASPVGEGTRTGARASTRAAVADVADAVPPPVEVERWAGALAVATTEVLVGSRPPQQLSRWYAQEVYAAIVRRAGLAVRLHGRPARRVHAHLVALRSCTTPSGSHEVSAAVHDGTRVRAVALRVAPFGGRWRVDALVVG